MFFVLRTTNYNRLGRQHAVVSAMIHFFLFGEGDKPSGYIATRRWRTAPPTGSKVCLRHSEEHGPKRSSGLFDGKRHLYPEAPVWYGRVVDVEYLDCASNEALERLKDYPSLR